MTRNAEHTPSPQSVVVPVDVVAACRGEQEHFEAWAKLYRYDMSQHPLHYIFTDPKTDAARMGWKAALAYVHDAAEPLAAAPAPSSLAGGEAMKSLRFIANMERNTDRLGSVMVANWIIQDLAALSPEAPARDGVDARAVAKALNPALFSHDKVEAHRAASPMTVTVARSDAVETVRKVLDAAEALTPRHEAPAEGAGEREEIAHEIYDFLNERFPDGALPGGVQLFADAGDHTDAGMKHEAGCDELAGRILALRARSSAPEARDLVAIQRDQWVSCSPEWLKNHPNGCAEAPRVACKTWDGHSHYHPVNWPAAPSADKLRIEVEALEKISTGTYEQGRARTIARQALTALKAEGAK